MNKLIDYLRSQNVSLNHLEDKNSYPSIYGTLVYHDNYKNSIKLQFYLSKDIKWNLIFYENDEIIKSIPIDNLKWRNHFTFIVFNDEIYFYSKSKNIAMISSIIAMFQELNSIPCSESDTAKNKILIVLMRERGFKKFGILLEKDIEEIRDNDLKDLNKLEKNNISHGLFEIYAFIIPYILTETKMISGKSPCLFPSKLPKKVYSDCNDNAIIQGIRALRSKINSLRAILDTEEETPLELTKQKLIMDIQKLECQIEMKKKDLLYQLNSNQNNFFTNVLNTVSLNKPLSSSIDFNGHYEIPSADVCAQIQNVIDTL